MSKDFVDMTTHELAKYAEAIQGEWNGDEPGQLEDRANTARELFSALASAYAAYKELESLHE